VRRSFSQTDYPTNRLTDYPTNRPTAYPTALLTKPRIPRIQKNPVRMRSADATVTMCMCGSDGVSTARIPSDTYTSGLTSTAYFMNGTADNPCHG